MSARMKKHPIKHNSIRMQHAGIIYIFPIKIAEKYRVPDREESVSADVVFAEINKKYTRPGALMRGIRAREEMTQVEMAKKIGVTQSDISQMENGKRRIGRTIAKRIEKLFHIDYRSLLA
ncbi:MAG: helix-turn-helix transcriptional regulator [Gammaproteobacteria bacterium]|nr:helix-turn-helix transcriptional regulator [Gammaproteobacteria bacterium]